jgi:hypothetical protein
LTDKSFAAGVVVKEETVAQLDDRPHAWKQIRQQFKDKE